MKRFAVFILITGYVLITAAAPDVKDRVATSAKFRFLVLDKKTKLPLDSVEIKIYGPGDSIAGVYFTAINGTAEIALTGGLKYRAEYRAPGKGKNRYFTESKTILKLNSKVRDTTELTKILISVCPRFPNFYFSPNSDAIEDTATLHLLLTLLKENPGLEMELLGHSDCRGSKEGNMAMSLKRAKALANYLYQNGISKKRILVKGYGDTRAVNPCDCHTAAAYKCREEEYRQNRRVEIRLTKI